MSAGNPYQSPSATVSTTRQRPMQPLSKFKYFGTVVGSMLISLFLELGFAAIDLDWRNDHLYLLPIIGVVLWVPTIVCVVAQCLLVYRMWDAVRDGEPYTTPGMAVGLLFVPIFNLYWALQAYWGWTKDFNRYAIEKNIAAPRMPEGLALTMCIVWALAFVCRFGCPAIGWLLGMAGYVLLLIFMNSAIDGVNCIVAAYRAIDGHFPAPYGVV